jgi:GTP-binding protein
MFRDEVRIFIKAGTGGHGMSSFRHEKFRPKGGPDGGNGGRGGDVVIVATAGLSTLYHLTYQKHHVAQNGARGGSNDCNGRNGRGVEIKVPAGTIVKDGKTGIVLRDLNAAGMKLVVGKGGAGGRGNAVFTSSTHQTPRRCEPGERGEERWVDLELKLIADIGLVGLPNAGKSTLISKLSKARPKIADYPFTTLHPYLGIVEGPGFTSFVMADLPGLIEGAHKGVGLGDKFLRHIERTRIIVHIIDVGTDLDPSPSKAYDTIRKELDLYSPKLAEKPEIIVANKMDLPDAKKRFAGLKRHLKRHLKGDVVEISAIKGEGLKKFVLAIAAKLAEITPVEAPSEA